MKKCIAFDTDPEAFSSMATSIDQYASSIHRQLGTELLSKQS